MTRPILVTDGHRSYGPTNRHRPARNGYFEDVPQFPDSVGAEKSFPMIRAAPRHFSDSGLGALRRSPPSILRLRIRDDRDAIAKTGSGEVT